MIQKLMSGADTAIQLGLKLISLAIVLQVVFSEVPFFGGGSVISTIISLITELGNAGLVGILSVIIIYRLLSDDVKKELSE